MFIFLENATLLTFFFISSLIDILVCVSNNDTIDHFFKIFCELVFHGLVVKLIHILKIVMEDNFGDLRISDQSKEDDISLSKIKVKVRRQDATMEEVFLG